MLNELTEECKQIIRMNKERQSRELENWFNKELIDDEDVFHILITYAGNENRWQLFGELVERANLTNKAFNIGLKEAWTSGIGTGDYMALEYFEEADKLQVMDKEELAYYNSLPNLVTLYRGCNKCEVESGTLGFSWTTQRKVAEFFAFRHEQTNTSVYSIKVPKEDISTIFLCRNEFEVIYLHACAKEMSITTEIPTEYYDSYIKEQRDELDMFLKDNSAKG